MHQHVIKSDGSKETIKFDKITTRIRQQCKGLNTRYIVPTEVTRRVAESVVGGITTAEIDRLIATEAARLVTIHPDYSVVAARVLISRMHKHIPSSFSENIALLYDHIDPQTAVHAPLVSEELFHLVADKKAAKRIDRAIQHERDFNLDYFGLMTLRRGYLRTVNHEVAETPQYMWMRVALGIHGDDISAAIKAYNHMSTGFYTHATPTLFNAGTARPQMSSCFLQALRDDSIKGIFETFLEMAEISKHAGGLGVHIHNVRAKGSYIAGTGGESNGIVPMLKVMNAEARYVDQGGGKRKGSFAVYLEPWHADVEDFLELKKNHGKEEMRARDLFYALWVPDLFMRRVKDNGQWSLMCPHTCPGLSDVWGKEFEELYEEYEAKGSYTRQLPARELWTRIIKSQIETGTPYLLYKDAANAKSNQKNLGTIKSSNLCTEIIEYSAPGETAVCNLASIALASFVDGKKFDFAKLQEIAYEVTVNLNKVIDRNYYPTAPAENSNMKHRPIGIGVQGLANAFARLGLDFDSPEALDLDEQIFATIYYGALDASADIAKREGPYSSYEGSPASQGLLQFDMWDVEPTGDLNWDTLRRKIKRNGLRNSLLVAPMPTASTSQILGNNECFEPFTSNIYVRRVLSGEFVMVNKELVHDLIAVDMWNDEVKNDVLRNNGSVQGLTYIPPEIRNRYKTVWEISQKTLIDHAARRAPYICQSQSMNLFLANPTVGKVNSMHFYSWEKGLKTGMYYLRSKAASMAKKITVREQASESDDIDAIACSIDNPEDCMSCGS